MKTILISGSSGFIATAFMQHFSTKYKFIKLSHNKQIGHITIQELKENQEILNSVDVIVNLAGANIGEKRWGNNRKQELLDSRIKTTNHLVEIFNKLESKPHFISASAVGIYNPNQDNDEDTLINHENYDNFSQEITRKWEIEAKKYSGDLTITRFGVVLGGMDGAFPKMLKPFLLFMGGKLGDGKQYFPWISLIDLLNALDYIINSRKTAIYNLVSPEIITNQDLSDQISRVWDRPCWLHLPKTIIKLVFGQMGQELFLNSLKVFPKKLIEENFNYQYSSIKNCLLAIKSGLF